MESISERQKVMWRTFYEVKAEEARAAAEGEIETIG